MSNRTLKNLSFCVLPFIEHFQNLNGQKTLCCNSTIPVIESQLDGLRSNILNEEKIPHCNKCYQQEQRNEISMRQLETSRWLRDSDVKNYIDCWHPGVESKIFFYDLRFDNKCNLACITCSSTASSLWAQELGIKSTKHHLDIEIDKLLAAKKIYLAGGEPMIIDKFIDLINLISEIDQQPELIINTNLTRVNDNLKLCLMKIKKLTLVVSIDAYGSINEYHRWPMAWDKLVLNLEWAKSINCTIQFNTVVDAVSILNLHKIQELESFADHWNLVILDSPDSLVIANLPEHLKLLVLHDFKKIKKSKFYKSDPVFKSKVDSIERQILLPGNHKMLALYINDLDKRRNIDHQDYLGVKLT